VEELEALGRPLTLVSEELGERAIAGGGPPVVVLDPARALVARDPATLALLLAALG
jgi:hypothetical protein